jgi:kynureninase
MKPELASKLQPRFTGWMAHENPFAFEIGANKFAPQPYRMMNGTPNVPALYAAQPGLRIVAEAGAEAIREKSKRQVAMLIDMADERGWRVNTPRDPERRAGTVSLDIPKASDVCAELLKRDVLVDYRPKCGIRMAPHFYTTDEEIRRAVATVDELIRAS